MKLVKGARQLLRHFRYALGNIGFSPHITTFTVNGEDFQFQISDSIGKQWYEDTSPREDPELRFICDQVLRPGQKIVDCGAHHGMFALVFARRVGAQGKVLAFEPSPLSAATCRKNAEINQLDNIEVVECALSDRAGQVATTGDSNLEILAVPVSTHMVETAVLDDFLSFVPDVIKIDIEGFEVQALRGMRRTIERFHPSLLVEVHTDLLENYGVTVDDVLEFMSPDFYDLWVQWDSALPPVPFDREQKIDKRVHLFALARHQGERAAPLSS